MKLIFPIYMLMTESLEPFVVTDNRGSIWPLFKTKENAAAFAVLLGRANLGIPSFMSAKNLLKMMEAVRPDGLLMVWMNEQFDTSQIQFLDRLPADEFFEDLKSQAEEEGGAGQN